jgi:hypothetical protein
MMGPRILCLALLLGACGCSANRVQAELGDAGAAKPAASPRSWSLADLPKADLSDEAIRAILSKAPEGDHHLSLDTSDSDWTFSEEEQTNRRLNQMEVRFLLNRIPLGTGDQGLANLRKLAAMLPRGTYITADHPLTCQTNRWSERIRKIGEESMASSGVTIQCDGGA